MKNRFISSMILMLLLTAHLYAQDEHIAWRFVQELSLSEAMQQDADLQVELTGDYLLVAHPNLAAADDGCGLVDVYARAANGRFAVIQTLTQTDFGTTCTQPDSFGFALDYADGVLVIGAPGPVAVTDETPMLSSGAVFVYTELESSGFQAVQALPGTGDSRNLALGTRVETDGQLILVQGNQTGDEESTLGRAIPRTVNLFTNGTSGWQLLQTLTNVRTTMFGQDFAIGENQIFINEHDFQRVRDCGRFVTTVNLTLISSYQLSAEDGQYRFGSGRQFINEVPGEQQTERFDQLFYHRTQSGPGVLAFEGFAICSSFEIGHLRELVQYSAIPNRSFSELARYPFSFILQRFVDNQDIPELPVTDNASISSESFAAVNVQDNRHLVVTQNQIQGPRSGQFSITGAQRLVGGPGPNFVEGANVIINSENTLLAFTNDRPGQNRVVLHEAIPALDPAITQAWWFGSAFNGQGVTFEVVSHNRLLMHWMTYDQFGNQMWLRGSGLLSDGEINIPLVRPRGPSFTFGEFDADDRVVEPWGQVTIQFDNCRQGTMTYQSEEFGDGQLPLRPLSNNNFECGTGVIPGGEFESDRSVPPRLAGSFFDFQRRGEGIILMSIPNIRAPLISGGVPRLRDRSIGFWLTYTPEGEQAWYYLGVYLGCGNVSGPVSLNCQLIATDQPRSTTGPIFGLNYDPQDRVTIPWGTAERFSFERASRLSILVDNPHGTGTLSLFRAILPVGYNRSR